MPAEVGVEPADNNRHSGVSTGGNEEEGSVVGSCVETGGEEDGESG